jgi:purine nucleoside phosphorylase
MEQVQIGIIGGSGLYDMEEVTDRREVTLDTPFGPPSGPYLVGTLRRLHRSGKAGPQACRDCVRDGQDDQQAARHRGCGCARRT